MGPSVKPELKPDTSVEIGQSAGGVFVLKSKTAKLFIAYDPRAVVDGYFCLDTCTCSADRSATIKNAYVVSSMSLFDALNTVGGLNVILPLFHRLTTGLKPIAGVSQYLSINNNNSTANQYHGTVAPLLSLIVTLLPQHIAKYNVKQGQKDHSNKYRPYNLCNFWRLLSFLLEKTIWNAWDKDAIEIIDRIADVLQNWIKDDEEQFKIYFKTIYLNFAIWTRTSAEIQQQVLALITKRIETNPAYYRELVGVEGMLDILQNYYSGDKISRSGGGTGDKIKGYQRMIGQIRVGILQIISIMTNNGITANETKAIVSHLLRSAKEMESTNAGEEERRLKNRAKQCNEVLQLILAKSTKPTTKSQIVMYLSSNCGGLVPFLGILTIEEETTRILALKVIGKLIHSAPIAKARENLMDNGRIWIIKQHLQKFPVTEATYLALMEILLGSVSVGVPEKPTITNNPNNNSNNLNVNANTNIIQQNKTFQITAIIPVIFELLCTNGEPEVQQKVLQDFLTLLKTSEGNREIFLSHTHWRLWLLGMLSENYNHQGSSASPGNSNKDSNSFASSFSNIFALLIHIFTLLFHHSLYQDGGWKVISQTQIILNHFNEKGFFNPSDLTRQINNAIFQEITNDPKLRGCIGTTFYVWENLVRWVLFVEECLFVLPGTSLASSMTSDEDNLLLQIHRSSSGDWKDFKFAQKILGFIDMLLSVPIKQGQQQQSDKQINSSGSGNNNANDTYLNNNDASSNSFNNYETNVMSASDLEAGLVRLSLRLTLYTLHETDSFLRTERIKDQKAKLSKVEGIVKANCSEIIGTKLSNTLGNYIKGKVKQWNSELTEVNSIYQDNIRRLRNLVNKIWREGTLNHLKTILFILSFLYKAMKRSYETSGIGTELIFSLFKDIVSLVREAMDLPPETKNLQGDNLAEYLMMLFKFPQGHKQADSAREIIVGQFDKANESRVEQEMQYVHAVYERARSERDKVQFLIKDQINAESAAMEEFVMSWNNAVVKNWEVGKKRQESHRREMGVNRRESFQLWKKLVYKVTSEGGTWPLERNKFVWQLSKRENIGTRMRVVLKKNYSGIDYAGCTREASLNRGNTNTTNSNVLTNSNTNNANVNSNVSKNNVEPIDVKSLPRVEVQSIPAESSTVIEESTPTTSPRSTAISPVSSPSKKSEKENATTNNDNNANAEKGETKKKETTEEGIEVTPYEEDDLIEGDYKPIEEVIFSVECSLVTPLVVTPGTLEITSNHIFFLPAEEDPKQYSSTLGNPTSFGSSSSSSTSSFTNLTNNNNNNNDLIVKPRRDMKKWKLENIERMYSRRHLLRDRAFEMFLISKKSFLFSFIDKTIRDKMFSRIVGSKPRNLKDSHNGPPSSLIHKKNLTKLWRNRQISNFEYLMEMNTIAGRGYNDLTQYPVFPWVLKDYSSEELDLDDPDSFRDLSKPIGALEPNRLEGFLQRYNSFDDPKIPKFHYGTHYSSVGAVLYYLVRLEPFTSYFLNLNDHKFDWPDRMFDSVEDTFSNVLTNASDLKELIPEFYYLPEMFNNINSVYFGLKSKDKTPLSDVKLPKWAKNSPEIFVDLHRQALESDYVSQNLHHWIDLIFGYQQRGKPAVNAHNLFFYLTYEGAVDLDSIEDPVERRSVEAQIIHFGQTPSQLFSKPHPVRKTIEQASKNFSIINSSTALISSVSSSIVSTATSPLHSLLSTSTSSSSSASGSLQQSKGGGSKGNTSLANKEISEKEEELIAWSMRTYYGLGLVYISNYSNDRLAFIYSDGKFATATFSFTPSSISSSSSSEATSATSSSTVAGNNNNALYGAPSFQLILDPNIIKSSESTNPPPGSGSLSNAIAGTLTGSNPSSSSNSSSSSSSTSASGIRVPFRLSSNASSGSALSSLSSTILSSSTISSSSLSSIGVPASILMMNTSKYYPITLDGKHLLSLPVFPDYSFKVLTLPQSSSSNLLKQYRSITPAPCPHSLPITCLSVSLHYAVSSSLDSSVSVYSLPSLVSSPPNAHPLFTVSSSSCSISSSCISERLSIVFSSSSSSFFAHSLINGDLISSFTVPGIITCFIPHPTLPLVLIAWVKISLNSSNSFNSSGSSGAAKGNRGGIGIWAINGRKVKAGITVEGEGVLDMKLVKSGTGKEWCVYAVKDREYIRVWEIWGKGERVVKLPSPGVAIRCIEVIKKGSWTTSLGGGGGGGGGGSGEGMEEGGEEYWRNEWGKGRNKSKVILAGLADGRIACYVFDDEWERKILHILSVREASENIGGLPHQSPPLSTSTTTTTTIQSPSVMNNNNNNNNQNVQTVPVGSGKNKNPFDDGTETPKNPFD